MCQPDLKQAQGHLIESFQCSWCRVMIVIGCHTYRKDAFLDIRRANQPHLCELCGQGGCHLFFMVDDYCSCRRFRVCSGILYIVSEFRVTVQSKEGTRWESARFARIRPGLFQNSVEGHQLSNCQCWLAGFGLQWRSFKGHSKEEF